MKKSFTFITDLPIIGKELRCPGHLELSGTATCSHPRDTDSYDYELTDVVLIKNGVRFPFYDIMASLSNGEPCRHPVIMPAIEAHLLFLFAEPDAPEITDCTQDVFNAMADIVRPNIFGAVDSDDDFMTTDRNAA